MANGTVTYARRVRPGDAVLQDGTFRVITKVRRAQGRKPPVGENLHLFAGDDVIKLNSLAPVRIMPDPEHATQRTSTA